MKLRRHDIFFLLIVIFLSSWHLDSSHNANTISRAATVASVVEHGTFAIDHYHHLTEDKARVGDHFYSEKAPLPSLLMIPIWWIAARSGLVAESSNGEISPELLRLAGSVCGSLPLSLIIFWIWRRLRISSTVVTSSWMSVLPIFGSFLFVYSGSFFGHLIAAFFLLFAWDRRKRKQNFMAGIFSSAAVLSEFSLFVFPLIWIFQDVASKKWNDLRSLILGGIPGLSILLIMNMIVTGSPFELPYSQVQSHADQQRILGLSVPSIEALIGLLFSPFRGLFIFAPVTILCVVAILERIGRMDLKNILLHPLITPVILLVLMIGSHSMWWGGWALGPRHLTTFAILIFAAGLPLLPSSGITATIFLLLSFVGLLINFAAKSTIWFSAPTEVSDPIFELIFPAFADRNFTPMQWPVLFGMDAMEAAFLFFILFLGSLLILRKIDLSIATNK